MPGSWALTPPYFLVFGFVSGIAGFRLGWRTGNRIALPLVQAMLGWMGFLVAWSIVGPVWAAMTVLAWAAGTSVASLYVFVRQPKETDARVMRAVPYRESMLAWLRTGQGPEHQPLATLTQHAREAIWYTAAAAATANLASIAMGAVLLNYMNAYVATLLRAATRTGVVLLLGWNVWSMVRVVAYVLIGAAAAHPVLTFAHHGGDAASAGRLAMIGALGIVADVVLKLMLSRPCGRLLARAVDMTAAGANTSAEVAVALRLD
jgi:hypothetical protein